MHPHICFIMAPKEKGYQTRYIITYGVAPACHKSSEAWSHICSTHVCYRSQGKTALLLHQTHKRVLLGSPVVAYVHYEMEWHQFLPQCPHHYPYDFQIQTDASGSWGYGAYFNGRWLQFPWSAEWAPTSIMAKEMVPILLSCAVWSRMLSKRNIEFKCDNRSAVEAIRKGSSKDIMAMHLLRCLWFLTAIFDIQITVSHIPGVLNTSADLLSRNQLKQFRTLHPQASTMPTSIPSALTMLIFPTKPDWTSSSFQHNLHELLPLNNN